MFTFVAEINGTDFGTIVPRLRKKMVPKLVKFGVKVSGNGALGLARHLRQAKGYDQNSIVWKAAKGNKKPFYNTGAWRKMPSFKIIPVVGDLIGAVEVGFVNNEAHPTTGTNVQTIAASIVKGGVWEPSRKQQQAFWAQVNKDKLNKKKGREYKGVFDKPARNFVKEHLTSSRVTAEFVKVIDQALKVVFKEKKKVKI